jgi:hypothetical protein
MALPRRRHCKNPYPGADFGARAIRHRRIRAALQGVAGDAEWSCRAARCPAHAKKRIPLWRNLF